VHFNRAETMEKSKGGRFFFFAHMIDHHHHDHRISHFFENRNNTVKPEITHTLGGHQILWVITGLIHYVL